ncbi:unnamed protein product [Colletotrichum noveboracense]|uniref:TIGR02453 family protein n=1 Tax=Colletotrichum noveboracense TaxID=2664923 RepID=A0A9W4RZ39_9PEZI|nr:hypothetical protein K456DRAFT_1729351 [Colletotrichum gloeosporioides 23]KAJ0286592.1 hypothetical protein COL940_002999 [Colletotrichum noveboracense]KAJ0294098.1 hypothetical protein CBS470a_001240 [Colletotrichum nupharicola]KAJ0321135.1 hypothetical protein Brms1b_002802 [Colletotrichum noveboracense]CAI0649309.1 unnamed protein product [Colletotrichum noveboracense]
MPARKRAASPVADEPRRRSGRISSTHKKSKYFEDDDDSEADFNGDDGFDENGEDESDVDEPEEEEEKPKRGRGRPKGAVAKPKPKAKAQTKAVPVKKRAKKQNVEETEDDYQDEQVEEDDEEEEEVEEDDDERKPRVTIIPLEKMRGLDGVEYSDETLHKNTLLFLKDLKANNVRSWLKSHDGEYRRALKDWQSFVETITEKITEVDFTIPELPVKDLIFRIHRDIRFSKNPTPYKPHFSAAWSRTGKKGPYACYYIHLEPGSCFVGGGLWCPEAQHLQALRASIDERPRRWRRVLNDERFKRTFLPKVKKAGEEAAILAFADVNKGNALKKRPMNYSADHRDIELLKLRNFTISKKVDDQIFTQEDAQEKVCEVIAAMEPFITFLNSIVMPDPNADDDESDSDEEGNEDENGDGQVDDPPEESGDDEEEEEGKDWSKHKF